MPRIASLATITSFTASLGKIKEAVYPLTNSGATDPTSQYWRDNFAPASYKWIPNKGIYVDEGDPLTNISNMFEGNATFNDPDISTWDTTGITHLYQTFKTCFNFNQDLSGWNTSSVIITAECFWQATNFNGNITSWDMSNVLYMDYMFRNAEAFNQNISNWNVSSCTDMTRMFQNANVFDQDLTGWNVTGMALDTIPVDFAAGTAILPTRNFPLFGRDGSQLKYYPITNSGASEPTYSGWSGSSSTTWIPSRGYITDPADPITNMSNMFLNKQGFNDPDLQYWDVSTVTNMYGVFNQAYAFNQPIGNWDVSNVTNMRSMFSLATAFNQDISGWNVGSVTNMGYMFFQASAFQQNISGWNVSSVTTMDYMFSYAGYNQDISYWDVRSVTNMTSMFAANNSFNQDLRWWNVSHIATEPTNFTYGVTSSSWTNKPLWGIPVNSTGGLNYYPLTNTATDPTSVEWQDNFTPSSGYRFHPNDGIYTLPAEPITTMNYMFYDNSSFNDPDIGSWNVSSVTNTNNMFQNATAFNQDIGGWDVSSVTNMQIMFNDAQAFNQDIGNWNVSNVTDMFSMFSSAEAFNQDISGWDVSSVKWMYSMFYNATAFNQDLRWWDVSQVVGFDGFDSSTSSSWTNKPLWGQTLNYYPMTNTATDPTHTAWRTNYAPAEYKFKSNYGIYTLPSQPITSMRSMFSNNSTFNDPDISTWDVSSVTNMAFMFADATAFNQDIGGWDVSSVIGMNGMEYMFYNATSFNQDLTSWNTSNMDLDSIPELFTDPTAQILPTRKFPLFGRDGSQLKYYPITDSGWNEGLLSTDPTNSTWRSSYAPSSATWITQRGYITDITDPITNMTSMFESNSSFNDPDLQYWDVSSVTNMEQVFYHANAFNQDIGSWNVSNVTSMFAIFFQANNFNQDIGSWNVSSVTNMGNMFGAAWSFNQDISNWDVSNVTSMRYMFSAASAFAGDITGWNVSSVTDMTRMFSENYTFDQDLTGWNTTSMAVDTLPSIFAEWDGGPYGSFPRRKWPLFGRDGSQLKYYPITNSQTDPTNSTWRSSYAPSSATWIEWRGYITGIADPITNMNSMFSNNSTFNDPDVSTWNTSSVTNMTSMFDAATAFNQDISGWNVSSVSYAYMSGMFRQAYAFNQDLRWWDVSNIAAKPTSFDDSTSLSWTNKPLWGQTLTYYPLTNTATDPTNPTRWSGYNVYKFKPYDGIYTLPNSPITNMSGMFTDNSSFNDPDIGSWNVSSVTNMELMFGDNYAFNQDIGGWNVSSVTNMSSMFINTSTFNQDIGEWNVGSVTNMSNMFYQANVFNQDLRWWNVSQIAAEPTDFSFGTSSSWTNKPFWGQAVNYYPMTNTATDPTYSYWRTNNAPAEYKFKPYDGIYTLPNSPITSMEFMFRNSSFNDPDIGSWNVSSVTNMGAMFYEATAFNQDISGWDVSNVTRTNSMFYSATAFNQDISSWDVSNVTNMTFMFFLAQSFNQPIGSWNVSSVNLMWNMFHGASVFNGDISGWNVSSVTNMNYMFYQASAFNQDLTGWNVTSMALDTIPQYFNQISSLPARKMPLFGRDGSQLKYYPLTNSGATDPTYSTWRSSYAPSSATWIADRGYVTNLTNPITNMRQMFYLRNSFNDPDIAYWDVSTVTNFQRMFNSASNFNQNIGNWDTSSVTDMSYMFSGCYYFNQPIGNWDVSSVTSMSYMLNVTLGFNQDLTGWCVTNITSEPTGFASQSDLTAANKPVWGTCP